MGRYLMLKFVVFIAIIASSCSKHSGCYTINGTVDFDKNGDRIMLFKFRGDSIYSVDTTVISEGRFRFTGREALDDVAIVTTGNYPGLVRAAEVVLERGEIEVFMDSISRVQGTRLNDLNALYHKRNKQFRDSINSRDQYGNFKLDQVWIFRTKLTPHFES